MKSKLLFLTFFIVLFSCQPEPEEPDTETGQLVGMDGNPRFNLEFTNADNVDLDLYVRTPNGNVIYFGNAQADRGTLDVDCACFGCPQGPSENIYWENGTATSGTYEYWVDYFESCGPSGASSSFTLRVIRNGQVVETKTGTLSSGQSPVWFFNN